jgi:type VI secretion system protein ImpH
MAYEDRETDHPLIRRIQEEGNRFSFFQAVYLLEQYCNSISKIARVGNQGPANIECIRFKPEASLGFPASDVVSVEKIDNSGSNLPRFQVTTSFLGLYGTDSPLPDFYTEDIIQADPDESNVKDFLDIFHHRLSSLFYRCWLKYRYYLQFISDGNDEFSKRVFAFVGMGTPGLTEKLKISPIRLLRYVGLFMQQNHSASALEILLSDYFDGIPVKIEECVGRWVKIDEEDRSALGAKNSQLGTKITVGNRVFDRTGKFRVTISISSFKEFTRFLPNGDNFKALKEIIEAFLPSPLDFELELILPGIEVPKPSLEGSMQLGWTSWSASTQPEESVSVIFQAS